MKEHGGTIQTFQVLEARISKPVFYAYAKEKGLEQAANGIYVAPDAMYLLHLRCGCAYFDAELHDGALAATVKKRGTLLQMQESETVFVEVEESPVMEKLWQSYPKNYSYADDLL